MDITYLKTIGHGLAMSDQDMTIVFSASPKSVSFPDELMKTPYGKIRGSLPCISSDGKYVAFYNEMGQLEVYQINQQKNPLIRYKFNLKGCIAGCIFVDKLLLVPVHDSVYYFDLDNPVNPHILYNGNKRSVCSNVYDGQILRLSNSDKYIVICHRKFIEKSVICIVDIESRDILEMIHAEYGCDDILVSNNNVFFQMKDTHISVCNSYSELMNKAYNVITLPNNCSASLDGEISYDGKYLSCTTVDCRACLIDVETSAILLETDCFINRHSFSNLGKHWLLDCRKKMIVTLD